MNSSHPKAHDASKSSVFTNYLTRHTVPKGNAFTHTSLGKPTGSFYLPAESYPTFLKMYADAIDNGDDIALTEKHRHISPVLIDLDFRFQQQGDALVRVYTTDHIKQIAKIYAEELVSIFQLQEPTFIMYVMEKPTPSIAQKRIKDGLHIVIPSIVSKPSAQYVLRNRVMPKLAPLFESIGVVNKVDDIVDEAVIERNNWMMYGSKKPNNTAYTLTHMLEYNRATGELMNVTDEYEFTTCDLVTEMSIRNKHDDTATTESASPEINEIEEVLNERRKKMETSRIVVGEEQNIANNEYPAIEEIQALVEILDPQRASNYNDWVRLGWCLRNIDHRLLDTWIAFSRKSPKFRDGECDRLWMYMRKSGLGPGTMHMWAKKDNPTQYAEIIRRDLRKLLFESRSGTHNDVARVVYHMFQHDYVCSSIRQRIWYEFRNHHWHQSDSAFTLRLKLSNEVWREYMAAARDLSHRATEATNQDQQEKFHEYAKKMLEIAQKLKTTNFKDNVMKECGEMFYIEKFEEKLDSYCNLIGFENGVYDLDAQEFREGRPEDFVSFSTNINYIPYDPSHAIVQDIKTYLSQVLTRPAVREYVMKLFSTFLHGAVKEQKFNIWTGSGCHAIDHPIMMADGSIKKVQDVEVGDKLMGDDSTARNVLQLCRGHSDMYRIVPIKGDPMVVNGDHVLSLVATNSIIKTKNLNNKKPHRIVWQEWKGRLSVNREKSFETEEEAINFKDTLYTDAKVVKSGDIIDIKVKDFMETYKTVGLRFFNLYRPKHVEFPEKQLDMDPYVMGAWLGDGSQNVFDITTIDDEIINYIKDHSPNTKYCQYFKHNSDGTLNKAARYGASKIEGRWKEKNYMNKCLVKYNVLNNKHIPMEYKCNTREVRMKVLAGLIDTDGTYQERGNQFTISLKSERLMDDLIYVARSLGFACYKKEFIGKCHNNGVEGTYFRTNIAGEHIKDIPTLLSRKTARERIKNKDVTRVGFKIEKVDDADFYGFELDGNHRYLCGDFIVNHNSNSKSLSINLFENCFGDYCCKFPITLLTQKRAASNAATSELARAKGKRFACLQEPSEDEKLNIGLMKELSGGDKIMARALFSSPIEFVPQFKMLLLCNHLPSVPSDDGGTWRRIRVVEFTSKFCDSPQEENEFPIDYELPNKMLGWKEHFMSMLIEYYKLYKIEGNMEPEEVLACTRDYKRHNDHLADFMHHCVEDKAGAFLSINEAFAELKAWAKDDNIPIKIPTKAELEKYMSKQCGKTTIGNHVKGFKNYRLKNRHELTAAAEQGAGEDAMAGPSTSGGAGAFLADNDDDVDIGDGID